MLLSVLIPTLENRRAQYERLAGRLADQIRRGGWEAEVEVLAFRDAGGHSVGYKRNWLLDHAAGRFVAFVDDDDEVSDDYVARVCEAIRRRPHADCIGFRGVVTFRGAHPREFVHSVRYRDYFSRRHAYYRPPYHLNPIRRAIACRYRFADASYSEDIDWALRIRDDGALAEEEFIDAVIYTYRSRRRWSYQLLLDHTEWIRHRLGLRLVNRLRLRRDRATAR